MMLRRRIVVGLFAAVLGAAVSAQTPAAPAAPAAAATPSPDPAANAATENLNLRFANGIVAVAEDKIITVADVMREVSPLLPQIRQESRNDKEFQERYDQLVDSIIQELIDRVLIIKEFRKDEKKHIPESVVDSAVADDLADRFDGDRSKFLAYLRAQGKTQKEYRKDKEEEIIYGYMRGQQKKSQSVVSPVKIEQFYDENKDKFYREDEVHLRLIQLTRNEGETDQQLLEVANQIMARFKNGEKFEDLAKEYSKDLKRSKGGDWSWQRRSDIKPEFSDPVFKLKKGEVTAPILLPEGCFILFAEDRHYAGIQPIDEVRDQIERILVTQMSNNSRERWLERLRRNGYVKHY
jgi:peptidyl-prolyl cis-trans isomerase SurA